MKKPVEHLREGWYGNREKYQGHVIDEANKVIIISETEMIPLKEHVNCEGLVKLSIKCANEIFVKMCDGLSGTIGNLNVDPNYEPPAEDLPINTFLATEVDAVRDEDEEGNGSGIDAVINEEEAHML